MPIPQKSFYHGAVLAEITEDRHFTSINKVPSLNSSSAYQINHNIGVYIKYTTITNSGSWRFTFAADHQDEIRRLFEFFRDNTFIVFVCENEGICIVDFGVFASCIDLNHTDSEWIEIYRPEGGSFRIRGANGEHQRAIPLSAFPRKLFE